MMTDTAEIKTKNYKYGIKRSRDSKLIGHIAIKSVIFFIYFLCAALIRLSGLFIFFVLCKHIDLY